MAFALYYEATRAQPVTEQEQAIIQQTIEKYNAQYPFQRKMDDFGVYEDVPGQSELIFQGSTKLPGNGPNILFQVANYWLGCLTEITHLLTNAVWRVTFDDVDCIFDAAEGWRFPTDEEYALQKSAKFQ